MLPPALNCRGQSAAWLVRTVKIYYKRTIHTINRSVLLVSTMQTFLARFNNATNNVRSAKKIKKKRENTRPPSRNQGVIARLSFRRPCLENTSQGATKSTFITENFQKKTGFFLSAVFRGTIDSWPSVTNPK